MWLFSSISQTIDMTRDSRAGFFKKARGLLNKCHEIIYNDDYVIMAQLGMSLVQQYTQSESILKNY